MRYTYIGVFVKTDIESQYRLALSVIIGEVRMPKRVMVLVLLAALCGLTGCSLLNRDITIIDAKIVTAVDDKLMPVKIADIFPNGTSSLSCWFKWREARINTQIIAKWHYVTDDVHILDHSFNIPKRDGMGSVMLSMPEGKTLPQGDYKVDLFLGKRLLRSLTFKVE